MTAELLLVVDLQSRLMPAIRDGERIIYQAGKLIQAATILDIPIVITEQYPKGLGATVDGLQPHLTTAQFLEKSTFSALAEVGIRSAVETSGTNTLVVCGAESHICVAQTVEDARQLGFTVHLITDAIGSRAMNDHDTAIKRLIQAGAVPHTAESQAFRWLKHSQHPDFKRVQALFK